MLNVMKTCSKCGLTKPLTEYHSISKANKSLRASCKDCGNSKSREYYSENREDLVKQGISNNKRNRLLKIERMYAFLLEHPCVECGETDPILLDFDHIDPTTKTSGVSELLIRNVGWERIQAEIDKCRILCVKCHRYHTARQKNWYMLSLAEA